MRAQVYSWRLSSDLKANLEREARARREPVSSILDAAVREWLKKSAIAENDSEQQRKLHAEAENCLGILASGRRRRAQGARAAVRTRLSKRHGQ